MKAKPKPGTKRTKRRPSSLPPSSPKEPHPIDALIQAEPRMDAKLKELDARKVKRLGRIARLEREFCGEENW